MFYIDCGVLVQGKESIIQVAKNIIELERECGLYDIIPEEDVTSNLKFGLVEVVYEWACGKVSKSAWMVDSKFSCAHPL